jgi:hypothetical protein
MENKVNTTDYRSEIIKMELFYIGKSSEKKSAIYSKYVKENDAIVNKIDKNDQWKKVKSERKKKRKFEKIKLYSFSLEASGVKFIELNTDVTTELQYDEIRIDPSLVGFYYGNQKGLFESIDNFYLNQGVVDLESKIKYHRNLSRRI